VRQVFVNLIANAVESMPDGGVLTVKVRPATDWRTGDAGVRITIADTGHGMSLETRKQIYHAFYTTKGSAGSGLGLWVTANIVRKHQGSIHVRSRRLPHSGGTAFTLIFPLSGAEGKNTGFQAA
jgi:signal transduction histidine kinase